MIYKLARFLLLASTVLVYIELATSQPSLPDSPFTFLRLIFQPQTASESFVAKSTLASTGVHDGEVTVVKAVIYQKNNKNQRHIRRRVIGEAHCPGAI